MAMNWAPPTEADWFALRGFTTATNPKLRASESALREQKAAYETLRNNCQQMIDHATSLLATHGRAGETEGA
jgi:hypothetical protein